MHLHLLVASLVESSLEASWHQPQKGWIGVLSTYIKGSTNLLESFPRLLCISHWCLVNPSGARQGEHIVPEISACFQQRQFPHWGRVHCAQPRNSNHGWGTRWPFAGGRGAASIRMVCLSRKGYLSPFSGLSPLHSVHVGLHLSHERCFGKLTVLPWQQQHQHLLMEQPFREWSLIQATTSINVLLLVLD